MLSSSIALLPLYRWDRYRAFGTDIVRNLAEASLAFILAVFRFASPAHCIALYWKILKASAEERVPNM